MRKYWIKVSPPVQPRPIPGARQQVDRCTGQQPKAIVDHQGILKVVYGSGDKIYYLESRDKAKSFSKPALVAALPGGRGYSPEQT